MGGLINTARFKEDYKAKVETVRLDTLLARLDESQKVGFKILDVEGAELQVLKGAGALLDVGRRPIILYESASVNSISYSYTPDDLFQFLGSKGYVVEKIDDENYLALPNTTR